MLVVKYYEYDSEKDLYEMQTAICLRIFVTEGGLILETNIGDVHTIVIPVPLRRLISISVKE